MAQGYAVGSCISFGTYGSPRIHSELKDAGEKVSRKRIARLMRETGVSGLRKRRFKRTTDSEHSQKIAENLVARDFNPTGPNQIWASDITYVRTWQSWVYLAVVIDLFSRRVVGWEMAEHMRTELVLAALQKAIKKSRTRTDSSFRPRQPIRKR